MHKTRKIVVVGSANMDMVIGVERLPREGETITAPTCVCFREGRTRIRLAARAGWAAG